MSRRALLTAAPAIGLAAAGAALVGVQEGALPGRAALHRALGWTGPDGVIPQIASGHMETGSFRSTYRNGARTGWALVRPPGVAPRLVGGVAPAGFSSPAEYNRYSVFGRQRDLTGIRVRVDIGRDDPFLVATRRYIADFPTAARVISTVEEGAHDQGYWRRMLPAELAVRGRALAS